MSCYFSNFAPHFKRGYQRIMAYKNNRNSREDKSLKNKRFEGNSQSEQSGKSNMGKKKLFGQQSENNFTKPAQSSENNRNKADRGFEKRKEDRPFSKKPYEGKSKEDTRRSGARSFDKKPFEGREREERREGDKRSTGRSFEKKPFESRGKNENRSERSSGDRRSTGRSFEKKPFESRDRDENRSLRREGDRASGSFEKRPFNKDRQNPEHRSYDRKPFSERNSERPERSFERKPYSKSAGEKRSWTSEERLEHKPQTRARKNSPATNDDGLIRLNRYIANAGICSRRKADELIEAGVVSVNGEVVSELGYKVDPAKDIVRYNGETLKREKMIYVLLNKPKDYITTTEDPQERRTVMQLVEKASRERIYPVGRLDRNTTGLLLMTNDGDLAEKLAHPRNNITKIYQAELNKNLTQGDFNKIQYGLELEDGFIKPDVISYVQGGSKREIGIQIHSGKNRIVRRIFEHLGYEVAKLDRVIYANLTKKDLPRGRWRYLEEKEIIQLKHLIH